MERDNAKKLRVLVVEDQSLVAEYFEAALRESGRYELARTLASAETAYFHCAAGGVDLVLMDVFTALGADGIDACVTIKARCPQVKVIVVTSMPEASSLARAQAAGADSFWFKEDAEIGLIEVMDRTMAGEHVWPGSAPEVQLGAASSADLSPRELQVLRLVVAGMSNREIADELGIGAATAKDYVGSILTKTGFKSRVELAVEATRTGLIIRREGE